MFYISQLYIRFLGTQRGLLIMSHFNGLFNTSSTNTSYIIIDVKSAVSTDSLQAACLISDRPGRCDVTTVRTTLIPAKCVKR